MIGHYLAGPVFLRCLGDHCKPGDEDQVNVPPRLYGPQKCTNQTALLDYILLSFPFFFCVMYIYIYFFCFLFSYFTSFLLALHGYCTIILCDTTSALSMSTLCS